ncbi:hypothetical protein [Mesorhizobium waimense]|uniref:hypothetical protein n=1 Tax=Mesorhizobium waimense TaxID=1300307 RepID=UPI001ABF06B7|nr:hypothetical protein [Mesorhizobium waimense]
MSALQLPTDQESGQHSNDERRHQQVGVVQPDATGKFAQQPRHGQDRDAPSERRPGTRPVVLGDEGRTDRLTGDERKEERDSEAEDEQAGD